MVIPSVYCATEQERLCPHSQVSVHACKLLASPDYPGIFWDVLASASLRDGVLEVGASCEPHQAISGHSLCARGEDDPMEGSLLRSQQNQPLKRPKPS